MSRPYLDIKNLIIQAKSFEGTKTILKIDSLQINRGETFGVIGESGTGKTVLAQAILGLLDGALAKHVQGEILFEGRDLMKLSPKTLQQEIRGKKISMIFQDPMSSLNPVFTVGSQLVNVLVSTHGMKKTEAKKKAVEWLHTVKLPDAEQAMSKYPHELSGGQRQRVIIALALACGAEMIIADEPTRNLDVTIQAGILQLLKQLQRDLNATCLFISNNPSLAHVMCDRVAVLQKGTVVEMGLAERVLGGCGHPYTRMLLHSLPEEKGKNPELDYALAHRDDENASGCAFYTMCPHKQAVCMDEPPMQEMEPGHFIKCHFLER